MTSPAVPSGLAELDHASPFPLTPDILSQNLAALRQVAPRLAEALETAALPAHWRAVTALDGSPTFRVERPGEPAGWLGSTAAPLTRAQALVGGTNFGEQNVALPGGGAGSELRVLLGRLAAHQAVFCFTTPIDARAVLSLSDFADAIARERLVLLVDEPFEDALAALLNERPGLLPPATIVSLPDVPAERIEAVRRQCEAAARRVLAGRAARLDELRAALAETRPAGGTRFALVALSAQERGDAVAREMVASAARIELAAEEFVLDSPPVAHPIALAEMFARFQPTHVLRCDPDARPLSLAPANAPILRFCASPVALPTPSSGERPLASGPRVRRLLIDAGFRNCDVTDFFWACPVQPAPGSEVRRAIAILGDLPNASAAACGIEQATHRALWQRLEKLVTSRWGSEDVVRPAALLQSAERELGFSLQEPDLRARLLRLIEYVLIPAVVLRQIQTVVASKFDETFVIGRGWSATERSVAYSSVVDAIAEGVRPAAAVATVLPMGLSADLLQAAGAGWPLLLHIPPKEKPAHWLAEVLEPGRHVVEFSGERELQRALEQAGGGQLVSFAAAARAHISARHTWDVRLAELAAAFSCS